MKTAATAMTMTSATSRTDAKNFLIALCHYYRDMKSSTQGANDANDKEQMIRKR
jgi:hypothetical protein